MFESHPGAAQNPFFEREILKGDLQAVHGLVMENKVVRHNRNEHDGESDEDAAILSLG